VLLIAAKSDGITGSTTSRAGFVDTIYQEPFRVGAHSLLMSKYAENLKQNVIAALDRMEALTTDELLLVVIIV